MVIVRIGAFDEPHEKPWKTMRVIDWMIVLLPIESTCYTNIC